MLVWDGWTRMGRDWVVWTSGSPGGQGPGGSRQSLEGLALEEMVPFQGWDPPSLGVLLPFIHSFGSLFIPPAWSPGARVPDPVALGT